MLNRVVLPAPFGPISPTIAPSGIVRSTWLTATRPPKRRTTPRASSRGWGLGDGGWKAAGASVAVAEPPVAGTVWGERGVSSIPDSPSPIPCSTLIARRPPGPPGPARPGVRLRLGQLGAALSAGEEPLGAQQH